MKSITEVWQAIGPDGEVIWSSEPNGYTAGAADEAAQDAGGYVMHGTYYLADTSKLGDYRPLTAMIREQTEIWALVHKAEQAMGEDGTNDGENEALADMTDFLRRMVSSD